MMYECIFCGNIGRFKSTDTGLLRCNACNEQSSRHSRLLEDKPIFSKAMGVNTMNGNTIKDIECIPVTLMYFDVPLHDGRVYDSIASISAIAEVVRTHELPIICKDPSTVAKTVELMPDYDFGVVTDFSIVGNSLKAMFRPSEKLIQAVKNTMKDDAKVTAGFGPRASAIELDPSTLAIKEFLGFTVTIIEGL